MSFLESIAVVYIIKNVDSGLVKIGITSDVERRFNAYKSPNRS